MTAKIKAHASISRLSAGWLARGSVHYGVDAVWLVYFPFVSASLTSPTCGREWLARDSVHYGVAIVQ